MSKVSYNLALVWTSDPHQKNEWLISRFKRPVRLVRVQRKKTTRLSIGSDIIWCFKQYLSIYPYIYIYYILHHLPDLIYKPSSCHESWVNISLNSKETTSRPDRNWGSWTRTLDETSIGGKTTSGKKTWEPLSQGCKKKESSNQLPTPLGLTTSKPICIFEPAIDHFRQRFERPKEKPHSCGQQKDIITVDRCKMALLDTLTCSF